MLTRMKLLALAAISMIGIEFPAHAIGPNTSPDVSIYIGGGSDQRSVFVGIAASLLNAGFDLYTDGPCGSPGGSANVVYGTGKATLPAALMWETMFRPALPRSPPSSRLRLPRKRSTTP